MTKTISILYSGGLDSLIMKHYAKINEPAAIVKYVYFKHGAESETQELKFLPSYVEVRSLDWLGDKIKPVTKKEDPFAGAIYIPGRNLIFAALTACQDLTDEIWMGTLADENNEKGTDKNEEFRSKTSELLSYVLSPFKDQVKVRFPFVEEKWTKVDTVKWALENGLLKNDILNTVSCWHHDGKKPCGKCKQCFKRWLVFKLNGISENYYNNPISSDYGRKLISGYLHEVYINKSENLDEVNVCKMIVDLYRKGDFTPEIRKTIEGFLYASSK